MAYRSQPAPGPSPRRRARAESRFEAGDVVVVLGEPESLTAAEIGLLQGTK